MFEFSQKKCTIVFPFLQQPMNTAPLTEKEQLRRNQIQMSRLAATCREDFALFRQVSEVLPFVINLNRRKDLATHYCNGVLEDYMQMPENQIREKGFERIIEISDPKVLSLTLQRIDQFEETANMGDAATFLQRLIFRGRWTWYHSHKLKLDAENYLNLGFPLAMLGAPGRHLENVFGQSPISDEDWQRFHSLTRRERQILYWVAEGLTSRQIGEQFFVSEMTVKTHRRNLMQKIGAKNLAQALRFEQAVRLLGL